MKKVINNRLYDTDTATEIGSDSYSNSRDFHHWVETLFRKKTGEYFLHGVGGPMSRYAVTVGQNSWSGGEKIIPLTPEKAREWAEEHLDADAYAEEFGEPAEDDSATVLSISLPGTVVEQLRRDARERGISVSALILEKIK